MTTLTLHTPPLLSTHSIPATLATGMLPRSRHVATKLHIPAKSAMPLASSVRVGLRTGGKHGRLGKNGNCRPRALLHACIEIPNSGKNGNPGIVSSRGRSIKTSIFSKYGNLRQPGDTFLELSDADTKSGQHGHDPQTPFPPGPAVPSVHVRGRPPPTAGACLTPSAGPSASPSQTGPPPA